MAYSDGIRQSGFESACGEKVGAFLKRIEQVFLFIADQPQGQHRNANKNDHWSAEIDAHMQNVQQQRFGQEQEDDRYAGQYCNILA